VRAVTLSRLAYNRDTMETMGLRSSMSIVVMIMDREIITYTNGLEESGSREYL